MSRSRFPVFVRCPTTRARAANRLSGFNPASAKPETGTNTAPSSDGAHMTAVTFHLNQPRLYRRRAREGKKLNGMWRFYVYYRSGGETVARSGHPLVLLLASLLAIALPREGGL